MIEVQSVHKSFGDKHVLRGLSFEAKKGHITGLVGPNGSGKTTIIRILTGFYDSDGGAVLINGEPMSIEAIKAKRLVGYTPENAPSYRENTVSEYLRFIARIRGVSKQDLNDQIDRAVDAFSLNKVRGQAIGTLSKGYRHRVSLAQSLLGDPPVIVLDEPTDGLDPLQKIETRKIIQDLAKTKAVLLTTHLLEEVELLCDRVVLLGQGQVAFAGTIDEVRDFSTSNTIVCLTVASVDPDALENALTNQPGVISSEYTMADGFVHARLSMNSEQAVFHRLNEISLKISEANLRIVELRCEESPLSVLYKPQD